MTYTDVNLHKKKKEKEKWYPIASKTIGARINEI